jgi:hypothetical protein
MTSPSQGRPRWHDKLVRSAYLLVAILLHLVVLLMFADWIVFRAPPPPVEAGFTGTVKLPPVHVPPTPPPPAGGDTANALAPTVQATPPPMQISAISAVNASSFSISPSKIPLPNIPSMSVAAAVGAGMAGHQAPGATSGSGSPFGSSDASGGTGQLVGYLYDLKQTRDGKPTGMGAGLYGGKVTEFLKSNWDPSLLDQYYKVEKPLYATSIFIPIIDAADGPKAFGVADKVQPNLYLVWYKVTAAPSQDGTYHFAGIGDDILEVRVDGKTVLDGSSRGEDPELRARQKSYPLADFDPTYDLNGVMWIGTPFHVSAGEAVDIEVLIGEQPGGKSDYFLWIQREESPAETQSNGSPLLPVFQLDSNPVVPAGAPRSFPPFSKTPVPWVGQSGNP